MITKRLSQFKLVSYLTEVQDELRKVIWPTKRQTIQMTIVVIVVSALVGSFLGGLDFVFTKITEFLIKK